MSDDAVKAAKELIVEAAKEFIFSKCIIDSTMSETFVDTAMLVVLAAAVDEEKYGWMRDDLKHDIDAKRAEMATWNKKRIS